MEAVKSTPVELRYDLATASNDGTPTVGGFTAKGDALPAEMLPSQLVFNDVVFHLAPAKSGTPNAIVAKGQRIDLPAGSGNRVYLLAASEDGDQKATFELGGKTTELNIEDWGGFIGQWDDREWSSPDTSHDNYGEMTGLKPGFIKRADLAWYASHHHDAAGKNVDYSYSYLFAYSLDVPPGARTLRLPHNDKIRILAISVANENVEARPAQPLYDVLPSPHAGAPDFTLSAAGKTSLSQGHTATTRVLVLPRGNFAGDVKLTAANLPSGVTATFTPITRSGTSLMNLSASQAAAPSTGTITVSGVSKNITHTASVAVAVTPILKGTVPVDLSSTYNITGIYQKNARFDPEKSVDAEGNAFAAEALGPNPVGDEVPFKLGPVAAPDAVTSKTLSLPSGRFASLRILATAVEGSQRQQHFTVNYTDGTSTSHTQSLSDWASSASFPGETQAVAMPYRVSGDGSVDGNPFYLFAYRFKLEPDKEVRSLTLPSNRNVLVFGVTLVPAASEVPSSPSQALP